MAFRDLTDGEDDDTPWPCTDPDTPHYPDIPTKNGRDFSCRLHWHELHSPLTRTLRLQSSDQLKVLIAKQRSHHLHCTFSAISAQPFTVTIKVKMSSLNSKQTCKPSLISHFAFHSESQKTAILKYDSRVFASGFLLIFTVTVPHPRTPSPSPSRRDPSYVGLRNQGATCYMNTFLQSLFQIPGFRKIIYATPSEPKATNIPFNLQRLFALMQTASERFSVDTELLTRSFGWSDFETSEQHDIQEFSRVLLNKLEEKMRGTVHEGAISSLFEGKSCVLISSREIGQISMTPERFYDLSLVVAGCSDLEASFDKYTELESLTGANQYNVPGHGPRNVEMRTLFLRFPTVLHCHLRRFEFNHANGEMTKVNSALEFPQILDLSKYLCEGNEHEGSTRYELFGVLVHSGGFASGHYYAFLRTSPAPVWYEFNDSVVAQVREQDAIERNFGGEWCCSAYMLIYVQQSKIGELFQPVDDSEIPECVMNDIKSGESSPLLSVAQRCIKRISFRLVTADSIRLNALRFDSLLQINNLMKSIAINSNLTVNDLIEKLASENGFNLAEIRLWLCNIDLSQASQLLLGDERFLGDLESNIVFVENAVDCQLHEGTLLFVCGFFGFLERQPYRFLSTEIAGKYNTFSRVFESLCDRFGFPQGIQYRFYYIPPFYGFTEIETPETKLIHEVFHDQTAGVLVFEPLVPLEVPPSRSFDHLPDKRFYLEEANIPLCDNFRNFRKFAGHPEFFHFRRPLDLRIVQVIVPSTLTWSFFAPYLSDVLDFPLPIDINELSIFVEANETKLGPEVYATARQLSRYATSTFLILPNASARPISVFVAPDGYHEIGGFQVAIGGSGQTFRDLFDAAVDLQLIAQEAEVNVRFVVREREDGLLLQPHDDFDGLVGGFLGFVRIEICPEDQREMVEGFERLCQIVLLKETYGNVKRKKKKHPFFFRLVEGETVREFKARLQKVFGVRALQARIIDKEFRELDGLECPSEVFQLEYQPVNVVLPPKSRVGPDRSLKIHN